MMKKLITISGETLMTELLPPTRMIVDGLIPQGLHIFGGAPKVGKSWLMLWLCLQVALGKDVWGLPTEKGTTLYLCLEDSLPRIQSRLFDITDAAPDNLHFVTASETLAGGLTVQLEEFILSHTDINLIVIDTLQLIRNTSCDPNAYANDYREIRSIKETADRFGIAIIVVHHLRKQNDADPVNMVSGTTGITGAVDGVYVLEKDRRKSRTAKFTATGRDIADREFTLEFDKQTHIWNLISDDSDNMIPSGDSELFASLISYLKRECSFIGSATELAQRIGTVTHPNVLSKKLLYSEDALNSHGITYSTSRTGQKRLLYLEFDAAANDDSESANDIKTSVVTTSDDEKHWNHCTSDDDDSNDDKSRVGAAPTRNMLSQPSQSSHSGGFPKC